MAGFQVKGLGSAQNTCNSRQGNRGQNNYRQKYRYKSRKRDSDWRRKNDYKKKSDFYFSLGNHDTDSSM